MLKAKKIRLDVSERTPPPWSSCEGKCRGLYNWLVMRLRDGERWHFAEEKARLGACRAYDPELDAGVRQTAGGSLLPAGQGHAGLLPPGQGGGDPWLSPGAALGTSSSPSATRPPTCALRGES